MPAKLDVDDFIESAKLGFNLGNAVKHIVLAEQKDDVLADLREAERYIQREIARRKTSRALQPAQVVSRRARSYRKPYKKSN